MDVARPLKAVFADPEWLKKMLLTGVISLVPILNIAVTGYYLAYQRNVADGRDEELPDWGDLGEHWLLGLQYFFASLVFAMPIIIVSIIMVAVIIFAAAGPGGSEEAIFGSLCGILALVAVIMVASLVLAVMFFALSTHFNYYRRFGAFFKFGEVWGIVRANAGMYFGALGMSWVVYMVMSMLITPVTYGLSFMTTPLSGFDGSSEPSIAAILAIVGVQFMSYVLTTILYVPATHVIYHYFGQYMARAYGLAPLQPMEPGAPPQPVAPAEPGIEFDIRDEDILPPPPPTTGGPVG